MSIHYHRSTRRLLENHEMKQWKGISSPQPFNFKAEKKGEERMGLRLLVTNYYIVSKYVDYVQADQKSDCVFEIYSNKRRIINIIRKKDKPRTWVLIRGLLPRVICD
jgi:hypothetical protein